MMASAVARPATEHRYRIASLRRSCWTGRHRACWPGPYVNGVSLASRNVLQLPALAELGLDELVGLLVVREPQVLGVPYELLVGEAPADGPEQHPFRVGPGDAEVRALRLPVLA